jgi:hypothetical protein
VDTKVRLTKGGGEVKAEWRTEGGESPNPSASAAAACGSVGPAALAGADRPTEASRTAPPEPATGGGAGNAELNPGDVEALRSLVRRAGGVEALIRWLRLHPDLG